MWVSVRAIVGIARVVSARARERVCVCVLSRVRINARQVAEQYPVIDDYTKIKKNADSYPTNNDKVKLFSVHKLCTQSFIFDPKLPLYLLQY